MLLTTSHCPVFFFFNDTATTEIYTLSLHDALPIFAAEVADGVAAEAGGLLAVEDAAAAGHVAATLERSEEHTSELQSHSDLVCRLLLEKKKNNNNQTAILQDQSARCDTQSQ